MMAHDGRLVHTDRLDGFWEKALAPEWVLTPSLSGMVVPS
jgi:hypothetical protein